MGWQRRYYGRPDQGVWRTSSSKCRAAHQPPQTQHMSQQQQQPGLPPPSQQPPLLSHPLSAAVQQPIQPSAIPGATSTPAAAPAASTASSAPSYLSSIASSLDQASAQQQAHQPQQQQQPLPQQHLYSSNASDPVLHAPLQSRAPPGPPGGVVKRDVGTVGLQRPIGERPGAVTAPSAPAPAAAAAPVVPASAAPAQLVPAEGTAAARAVAPPAVAAPGARSLVVGSGQAEQQQQQQLLQQQLLLQQQQQQQQAAQQQVAQQPVQQQQPAQQQQSGPSWNLMWLAKPSCCHCAQCISVCAQDKIACITTPPSSLGLPLPVSFLRCPMQMLLPAACCLPPLPSCRLSPCRTPRGSSSPATCRPLKQTKPGSASAALARASPQGPFPPPLEGAALLWLSRAGGFGCCE